jgi:ElaB/YqjD/DUF883 family membrane-anchored ribosome-binding protein
VSVRTTASEKLTGRFFLSSTKSEDTMATPEKEFQSDVETLKADIAALTETVGKLAGEASKAQAAMGKTMRKAARGAANVGEEAWDEAVNLGQDAADAARNATYAGVSSLERQIKANPLNAVLLALGVGFVIGLFGKK